MANKSLFFDRNIPPCPLPGAYILIETKEGVFWRKKRGLGKPAVLNDVLQANVDKMKISSPAAKRILTALRPFTLSYIAGVLMLSSLHLSGRD